MPAIPSPPELLENILVYRSTDLPPGNATAEVLEVICAWPVSGQYGPGTRVLYYALAAACVFARKEEWIRNPCLAAVLLFPAVAALHGIVLTALHRNGAVDMDVYGAFQLCTIGILTVPPTVRLSTTYFNNPGRAIIFLWTGLVLAGLLSLVVEFIRLAPTACPPDDPLSMEWAATGNFDFSSNSTCNMTCGPDGPYSPLRQDAADNIYVIPVPHELTFNTATLLAAACCIPAILLLVSTWIKILENNWERFSRSDEANKKPDENLDENPDESPRESPISGTNGATPKQMTWISDKIRTWLMLIEVPVFVAAVLVILIKGEMNFFSKPVRYQTEPIASIGQWAPIVGTGLGVVGSLYLFLAADMEAEVEEEQEFNFLPNERNPMDGCSRCGGCAILDLDTDSSTNSSQSEQNTDDQPSPRVATTAASTAQQTNITKSEPATDPGGRKKAARFLNAASRQLSAKAHSKLEDSGYDKDHRNNFPTVPGEDLRNINLPDVQNAYNTPQPRSKASSIVENIDPGSSTPDTSKEPPGLSRHLSLPVSRPTRAVTRQGHSNTMPSRKNSFESSHMQDIVIRYGASRARQRDLPNIISTHASRTPSISDISPTTLTPGGQDVTPEIVVSEEQVVSEDQGGH